MFKNFTTKEECYWLGFLYADGMIRNDKSRNCFITRIHLSSVDEVHAQKFNDFIDGKFYKYSNKVIVQRYDKYLYDLLVKYGLKPNKSLLDLHIPNIPTPLIPNFILGYFDGDGCITNSDGQSKFVLCNGNPQLLHDISIILKDIIGTQQNIYKCAKNTYQYQVRGNRKTNKLYKYLYNDSCLYLNRKKELWDEFRS